jgi:benzoate 4-monooxygenase
MEQHRKYGDFVRIGPNHISINNPEAASKIYGHRSGCIKGEFYDAFLQVTPNLFNVRDTQSHQRKRKCTNPAFSPRALQGFEPLMDKEICDWKNKLLGLVKNGQSVIDFTVWSESTLTSRHYYENSSNL